MTNLQTNSLVLYKNRPARVTETGAKKITIQTEDGALSVRPKDVTLLHAGPLPTLAALTPTPDGDVKTAWELLAGAATTLPELAELAYETFTPQTAWAVWQLLQEGLYFSGDPQEINVHTPAQVAEIQAEQAAKAAEEAAWQAFLARAQQGEMAADDGRFLQDVVALALGQHTQSKALRALGRTETPENAHKFLLTLGYWDETVNPHPARANQPGAAPQIDLPPLADEPRRDLTHLPAFAIDDEGSSDPDDAISWENGRLWIHVADVAALVPSDSPADVEARARGANLYLPEGTVTMLPPQATAILGLGLNDVSPALSFGLTINNEGELTDIEITPSLVRVTRTTYEAAEAMLDQPPLAQMAAMAQTYEARRRRQGAVNIDLPEVRVKVENGIVTVRPLPNLRSRDLVRDAMLMAGEAAARYAFSHNLPFPYTVQEAPAEPLEPATTLSEHFALRRQMIPSQQSSQPGAHFGLGMGLYAQATSPLRRYLDLVVHQQLRAHLCGAALLDEQEIMTRVGAADLVSRETRFAERQSIRHWLLVYLQQNAGRAWEGVIVDRRGKRDIVLIPELALDVPVYTREERPLDSTVTLELNKVNLPQLEASFRIVAP